MYASIAGPDSMRLFRCASNFDLNRQGTPLDPNSPNVLEIGTYVLLGEGENQSSSYGACNSSCTDGHFIVVGHAMDMLEYSYNYTHTPHVCHIPSYVSVLTLIAVNRFCDTHQKSRPGVWRQLLALKLLISFLWARLTRYVLLTGAYMYSIIRP